MSNASPSKFEGMSGKISLSISVESRERCKFYTEDSTIVFWDIGDYPLIRRPENQMELYDRFKQATWRMGFYGNFHIQVYGVDELNRNWQELFDLYCLLPDFNDTMADAVVTAAFTSYGTPRNLVIVAKQPLESELHRVLHCVNSRGHKVLLVDPKVGEDGFYSSDSIFESTRFLGGGSPISKLDCDSDSDSEEDDYAKAPISESSHHDVFKIEDLYAPVTTSKGPKTSVFWDLQDHPFPLGFSLNSIFDAIQSALVEMGWTVGLLSVWAYVDEKSPWCKYLGEKNWESRLYFLPITGDKDARLDRMFHDILLWEIDNHPDQPFESQVFVVSDNLLTNKEFRLRLKMHNSSLYGVIRFHCGSQYDDSPDDPQWPLLLLENGVYCNFEEEEEEESHKKKKVSEKKKKKKKVTKRRKARHWGFY